MCCGYQIHRIYRSLTTALLPHVASSFARSVCLAADSLGVATCADALLYVLIAWSRMIAILDVSLLLT